MISTKDKHNNKTIPKCMECKSYSTYYCINKHWECRFCIDCLQIILLFQHLLPQAKYSMRPKDKYDNTEMNTLRIESLQALF